MLGVGDERVDEAGALVRCGVGGEGARFVGGRDHAAEIEGGTADELGIGAQVGRRCGDAMGEGLVDAGMQRPGISCCRCGGWCDTGGRWNQSRHEGDGEAGGGEAAPRPDGGRPSGP